MVWLPAEPSSRTDCLLLELDFDNAADQRLIALAAVPVVAVPIVSIPVVAVTVVAVRGISVPVVPIAIRPGICSAGDGKAAQGRCRNQCQFHWTQHHCLLSAGLSPPR